MVNHLLCYLSHTNDERPFIAGVIDFTSGTFGAVVNAMVGLPLDTVKVKMQSFPLLYGGAFSCFNDVLKKYGFKGLYAGAVPAIIAEVSEKSVLFCAHGYCQFAVLHMTGNKDTPTVLESSVSGFLAAFFSSLTLCPTELIKCKLQALRDLGHPVANLKPYKITRDIIATHGIKGMFTGLTSTMMREMPGYFCYFGAYQMTKNYLTDNNPYDKAIWKTALAGGCGGLALWITIYPFDLVKTRIQIGEIQEPMRKVLVMIVRKNGFLALYRGVVPSLLRTFPSTAALFVVYENTNVQFTQIAESLGYLP